MSKFSNRASRIGLRCLAFTSLRLVLATFAVCHGLLADPYSQDEELAPKHNYYLQERNQRFASERQEQFRKRVAMKDAVGDEVFDEYAAKQAGAITPIPSSATSEMSVRILLAAAVILLAGVLVVRKLAPEIFNAINKRFNPWAQTPGAVARLSAKVRAEDEAFSEFLAAFQAGPSAVAGVDQSSARAETDALKVFFANAPKAIRELQKRSVEICGATSSAQRGLLADLRRDLRALKGEAGIPELLPVWQMASALEGLVKQLTDKASNITNSTLRTVAAGVDLLEALAVPGVPKELLANPPFRLLAVDDDQISRNAVSLALKKAFTAPDLAENAESALALVADQAYDVIFLDVQMPGLNGFELCTKIHDTVTNANTPVVFVTCHSDFEARAKSTLCGGSDLISKPFLTFEITVKALTLALRRRLQSHAHAAGGSTKTNDTRNSRRQTAETATDILTDEKIQYLPEKVIGAKSSAVSGSPTALPVPAPQAEAAPLAQAQPDESSPKKLLQAFMHRAAANLGPMRELIQSTFTTVDEGVRQEMLGDFFLRFNALVPEGIPAEAHPALSLTTALESLLTKLLANPKSCNSSTLLTVATAVDLLIQLCSPGVNADLATNPPVHLLVVDDDPVARRGITGALQIAFGKPENADSGNAAIALATKKSFDAIFLDVEMPDMDGFTTCMRIREAGQNRSTPVIFVTAHNDFKSRVQSSVSGGNDLLGKPFLPAEIKVKALTFALQGRLQKSKNCDYVPLLAAEAEPDRVERVAALP